MKDEQQNEPLEIVARFARCINFPRDKEGLQIFAQDLAKTAFTTGVSMEEIADRCGEISDRCPTAFDLLHAASWIATRRRDAADTEKANNQTAEWRRQYGSPAPYDWQAEAAQIMAERQGPRRDDVLWKALRGKFPGKWPDWYTLAIAARELGFEDYAKAWLS